MKKLLTLLILAVMLVSGTGVAGAEDTTSESKEILRISHSDDGYTIMQKPVIMD
ncbi:hypothetical protein [Salisediminibacterium selenitireducens]|uniref:Uncharacterized protein n=1 Tax=Bacillus selenitireducens (strain ATCC 700615 / DSM 15326 / MLS10) TaxID=439292 RepID=D6XZJ7_BACIE|nr:hypothetical protein [Salisediminibacterium selenitireducens]ADH98371.1 hypothetical protein Bsel_0845 [[Bacillus] selenitireducens MLS10]